MNAIERTVVREVLEAWEEADSPEAFAVAMMRLKSVYEDACPNSTLGLHIKRKGKTLVEIFGGSGGAAQ
jgi:hypothetical protein